MSYSVYLDCCALQRIFDDHSQPRIAVEAEAVLRILKEAESGSIELIASEVLFLEVSDIPEGERKSSCQRIISQAHHYAEVTPEVVKLAKGYEAAGLKAMDSVHLACAVASRVEFFCSCDDRLLSRATKLNTELTRVLSLLDLLQELKP